MTQKVDQNETSFSTVVANALRKKEKKIRKLFHARTRIYKSLYYSW